MLANEGDWKQVVADMVGGEVMPDDIIIFCEDLAPERRLGDAPRRALQNIDLGQSRITYFFKFASPDLVQVLAELEVFTPETIQVLVDNIPALEGFVVISNAVDRDASKPGKTLPPTPAPTSVPLPAPSSLPAPAPTGLPLPAPSSLPLPAPTPVPTCVETIDGPEELEVTIDEDDCKFWNVTGLIRSLTARRQRV